MSKEMTGRPHCLVIEDQALIAMSIETYLEEAGIDVQAAASIAEARAWLQANSVDIAVVDFQLKDGLATGLAQELKQRGIPFVIYSGYPARQEVFLELQDIPWLKKPASRDDLLKAVLMILAKTSAQTSLSRTLHS